MPTTYEYEQMLADQQHQLSMQVSEKEIEIERLKTTVFALNGKCEIVNDHLADVQQANKRFQESEEARAKLQNHMVETSQKVQVDSSAHKTYQDELISEIKSLQEQFQSEKQRQHMLSVQWR
jgi:trehalose/maltose hydrolase-like predicted phosphorylase